MRALLTNLEGSMQRILLSMVLVIVGLYALHDAANAAAPPVRHAVELRDTGNGVRATVRTTVRSPRVRVTRVTATLLVAARPGVRGRPLVTRSILIRAPRRTGRMVLAARCAPASARLLFYVAIRTTTRDNRRRTATRTDTSRALTKACI